MTVYRGQASLLQECIQHCRAKPARDDAVSDGQCMLVLDVVITRSTFVLRRFQKAQQCVAAVSASSFVFHVEKVAGGLQGGERSVLHMVGEQLGAVSSGVLVPFAVHEQHRYVDFLCGFEEALAITVQQIADMEVHLPVFMLGQGTDVPIIEALEQGRHCLLYTSPSPRDRQKSRMPSSA